MGKIYTYSAKVNSKKRTPKKGSNRRKSSGNKNGLIDTLKKAIFSFFAIIVLISLFLLYNWQYTSMNSDLIAVRKLENEVNALQRKNENVKIEIKKLTHVNRVSEIARKQLGLKPPEESPIVFYVDEKELNEAKRKDLN